MTERFKTPDGLNSTELVFQTIRDMHMSGRLVSREVILSATKLKMTIVDECIKRLREDGRIRKVINGVFEPVHMFENRAVSITTLPSGIIKIELGDQMIEASPWEAAAMGASLMGWKADYGR